MTRILGMTTAILLSVGCSFNSPARDEPASTAASLPPPPEIKTKTETEPEPEPDDFFPAVSPMPVYITPFYDSEGPKIEVGLYSQELTEADADSVGELAAKMKEEWALLPVETMYVLSIRLYDLGRKDDAVYWFYSAQARARLLQSVIPPDAVGSLGSEAFERIQAHNAFQQLSGIYINGYAFGKLDELEKTLRRVKSELQKLPEFKTIYPKLILIDDASWSENAEKIASGLDELVDYIVNHADEIKATRKENGIEGKY